MLMVCLQDGALFRNNLTNRREVRRSTSKVGVTTKKDLALPGLEGSMNG